MQAREGWTKGGGITNFQIIVVTLLVQIIMSWSDQRARGFNKKARKRTTGVDLKL